VEENNVIEWSPTTMLEVTLNEPDDFLKVRETLTRIGIASREGNRLFQSCHILHKQDGTSLSILKSCLCWMERKQI
jgi:hypothetical protein